MSKREEEAVGSIGDPMLQPEAARDGQPEKFEPAKDGKFRVEPYGTEELNQAAVVRPDGSIYTIGTPEDCASFAAELNFGEAERSKPPEPEPAPVVDPAPIDEPTSEVSKGNREREAAPDDRGVVSRRPPDSVASE